MKEYVTRLSLSSNELGLYHYDLKLSALSPNPERNLQFKVGLGNMQSQTLRFVSYAKTKVEYTCRMDSADFSVEKMVVAPPGTMIIEPSFFHCISYELKWR